MATAAKRPAGESRGKVAAGPDARQRHRASPRPYILVLLRRAAARGGVLGMATRPGRRHASRWSSSVQAMAYTMAVNRHITPKPGQGWRVWAEWWTLVS